MYRLILFTIIILIAISCSIPLNVYEVAIVDNSDLKKLTSIAYVGTYPISWKQKDFSLEERVIPYDLYENLQNRFNLTLFNLLIAENKTNIEGIDLKGLEADYSTLESNLKFLMSTALVRTSVPGKVYPKYTSRYDRVTLYDAYKLDPDAIQPAKITALCDSLHTDAILIGFVTNTNIINPNPIGYSIRAVTQLIDSDGRIHREWFVYGIIPQVFVTDKWGIYDNNLTMDINTSLTNQAAANKMYELITTGDTSKEYFLAPVVKIEKDNSLSIVIPGSVTGSYTLSTAGVNSDNFWTADAQSFPVQKKTGMGIGFDAGFLNGRKAHAGFKDVGWVNIGNLDEYNINNNDDIDFSFKYSNNESESFTYFVDLP